jgi:hypothetical protein
MSNIKMFPMAMLPGWLFAPKNSRRLDSLNNSLNIDSLNIDNLNNDSLDEFWTTTV